MTDDSGRHGRPFSHDGAQGSRSRVKLFSLLAFLAFCFIGFLALGTWQAQRLSWKEALIARVEQRIHAAPVEAPGPEQWPAVNAESDEYRHVRVTGTFLHERATKVRATTSLGSGYWLLTPLRTADGSIVLINRGFVPPQPADTQLLLPEGPSTVTGLLRMSEPGGAFLRKNDISSEQWYSRDVQAIARARDLTQVAPYFIDADANRESVYDHASDKRTRYPVGGLTVVSFPNNHLVYALTWYALGLMTAAAGIWVLREEREKLRAGKEE
ncbi:SURF1 family protein [Oxalobacteraceae bacterium R-40]|uniref:SURF1-like protein n=1 Tax=Keguizhuia sedimenti TaxID=3064264 RepID=A0ABU1BKV8_9BURK|nr:SURF1 family protein [Oxalobacteraceae bacterium R-40]